MKFNYSQSQSQSQYKPGYDGLKSKKKQKQDQTLLDQYLNHWTGDERANGNVDLGESSNFLNNLVETTEKKYNASVFDEYKEFLLKFDDEPGTNKINELGSIIDKDA